MSKKLKAELEGLKAEIAVLKAPPYKSVPYEECSKLDKGPDSLGLPPRWAPSFTEESMAVKLHAKFCKTHSDSLTWAESLAGEFCGFYSEGWLGPVRQRWLKEAREVLEAAWK
jgi:hypothetical protein